MGVQIMGVQTRHTAMIVVPREQADDELSRRNLIGLKRSEGRANELPNLGIRVTTKNPSPK